MDFVQYGVRVGFRPLGIMHDSFKSVADRGEGDICALADISADSIPDLGTDAASALRCNAACELSGSQASRLSHKHALTAAFRRPSLGR